MTNYQYRIKISQDLIQLDSDELGILRIEDAQGKPTNDVIPNNPLHPMWDNQEPFGSPGYQQWLEAGNTPLPSMSDEERLSKYKEVLLGEVMLLSTEIKGMLGTPGEEHTYLLKQNEIVLVDGGETVASKFPMAYAEAQRKHKKQKPTLSETKAIVETYRTAANSVVVINAQREAIRVGSKAEINSATAIQELVDLKNSINNEFDDLKTKILSTLR